MSTLAGEGKDLLENHIVLSGELVNPPQTRFSPAGIPITRFTLQHSSRQWEAEKAREVICRIRVSAAGEGLQSSLRGLKEGDMIKVSGFLSRSDYRSSEDWLVLHAQMIETIAVESNETAVRGE